MKPDRGISGIVLKQIAIVSMTIDHLAAFILGKYLYHPDIYFDMRLNSAELFEFLSDIYRISRMIGRLAFPIYCFLLVEGFFHTKNIKKYALHLFLFALISEIPFDLALSGSWVHLGDQNVFFTLFLGLCLMYALEYIGNLPLKYGISAILFAIAYYCNPDYSWLGLFLIFILYRTRDKRALQCVLGALCVTWELPAVLAFLPIYFYNGHRGEQNKYFFYLYYPMHLLLFYTCYRLII